MVHLLDKNYNYAAQGGDRKAEIPGASDGIIWLFPKLVKLMKALLSMILKGGQEGMSDSGRCVSCKPYYVVMERDSTIFK